MLKYHDFARSGITVITDIDGILIKQQVIKKGQRDFMAKFMKCQLVFQFLYIYF